MILKGSDSSAYGDSGKPVVGPPIIDMYFESSDSNCDTQLKLSKDEYTSNVNQRLVLAKPKDGHCFSSRQLMRHQPVQYL